MIEVVFYAFIIQDVFHAIFQLITFPMFPNFARDLLCERVEDWDESIVDRVLSFRD